MHNRLALAPLLAALCVALGCQDRFEMVTAAIDSATDTFDTFDTAGTAATAATDATATTEATTEATGSGTAGESTSTTASTTSTTGTPPCATDPECTAPDHDGGAIEPTSLPFFRGRACVATAAKPGQAIAVRVDACVHPCLSLNAVGLRHAYRCEGGACESFASHRYDGVTGVDCPSDVFSGFDPALCVYPGPIDLKVGPITPGGAAHEGALTLVIPFLTNEDADAIAAGEVSAAIWTRIAAHPQDPARVFDITLSGAGPDGPATCADEALCTCRDLGL
ncbi:MAG: hypothetical protein IPK80_35565 [Nannocystis sp.]|nr:hypothetical protein [Nannocystis sp.]